MEAAHDEIGSYWLYGRSAPSSCSPTTKAIAERLWGQPNATPYVKDAFHRRVVEGADDAVNPARDGTKFAAWHHFFARARRTACRSISCCRRSRSPHRSTAATRYFAAREAEANVFYRELLPGSDAEDQRILRQALAGMIWSKQFFHYDVERWLDGDRLPAAGEPPCAAATASWRHMKAARRDLDARQLGVSLVRRLGPRLPLRRAGAVDVDFAKDQIELMLSERYLHPNGQIPAYEWTFGDVNPPVHALAALKAFRAERVQRGRGDLDFLQRVFHKLLLNYAWWINRKDADGNNVFEGGFLGLDNISVFDRSQPLPSGYSLKQADATGWMAMFALNMTVIAPRAGADDPDYEDIAIQSYEQFLGIADAIAGDASGAAVAVGRGGRLLQGPDRRARRFLRAASTSTRWSA